MNDYQMLKLSEENDEAIKPYDFTCGEIEEMKKEKLKETENFKEKYFEYYDDVKSHTNKIVDW